MAKHPSNPLLHLALLCVFAAAPINCQNSIICKQLVMNHGYTCQDHQVTTDDGYILTLQRIGPPGSAVNATAKKPPVLLQHGLNMDAAAWLVNTKDQALALILASRGFDVWTSNARGTRTSRGHKTIQADIPAYWEWSWDQLAANDLPAFFNYINKLTGQKVHYVGHSLGTCSIIGALALQKVTTQIRSAALLSPVAYLNQMMTQMGKASANTYSAEGLYNMGVRQYPPPTVEKRNELNSFLCSQPLVDCSNFMVAVTGLNCCLTPTSSHLFFQHTPQTTSVKNIVHLSQMIRSGRYAMFDYVLPHINMQKYKQPTPPLYNIAGIRKDLPLFFGYGGRDALSSPADVNHLLSDMRAHNPAKLVKVYIPEYAHMDFIMGGNANQKVYTPLVNFFQQN